VEIERISTLLPNEFSCCVSNYLTIIMSDIIERRVTSSCLIHNQRIERVLRPCHLTGIVCLHSIPINNHCIQRNNHTSYIFSILFGYPHHGNGHSTFLGVTDASPPVVWLIIRELRGSYARFNRGISGCLIEYQRIERVLRAFQQDRNKCLPRPCRQ